MDLALGIIGLGLGMGAVAVFWTIPGWVAGKLAGLAGRDFSATPLTLDRRRRWLTWGLLSMIAVVSFGSLETAMLLFAVPAAIGAQWAAFQLALAAGAERRARRHREFGPPGPRLNQLGQTTTHPHRPEPTMIVEDCDVHS